MEPYKDTDEPLLKLGEEDVEALATDQLTVQGMLAHRFVKQFLARGGEQLAAGAVQRVGRVPAVRRDSAHLELPGAPVHPLRGGQARAA